METRTRARLVDHDIVELAAMLRDGRTTSVALTEAYLERIDRYNGPFDTYDANGGYNAFVRIDREGALAQAHDVDALLAAGTPLPPLAGIPIGVKDSIAIEGRVSTNGFGYPDEASVGLGISPFDGNAALADAEVVARLRKQKAVLIGHTTCSELSGNINGLFAGNAWDMRFACGGSSQGSGVAPIARLSAAAIGVETGGSIITPAAANGASSIKPAPGRVSASGIMQNQAGMDVPGPMARSVRDAALVLNAIYDERANPYDPLGAPAIASMVPTTPSTSDQPLRGLRIGYPVNDPMVVEGYSDPRPTYDTYEPEHRAACDRFREELIALGAEVVDFEIVTDDRELFDVLGRIPGTDVDVNAQLVAYVYNPAMYNQAQEQQRFAASRPEEQAAFLARPFFLSPLIIERTPLIDADLRVRAERARHRWRQRFQQALEDAGVDIMMGLPLGGRVRSRFQQAPLPVRRAGIATPNLLAWPAVIFPIGMTDASTGPDGDIPRLPISAMLWGPAFNGAAMVQAAIDFQHRFPAYHTEIPPDPTIDAMRDAVRPAGVPRVWPTRPDEVDGIAGAVSTR